ncbi:MAG: electron transfer flavoprotein subunit beta/FixA family protein [Bacteroidales bacterium]|jgi:electron transfer flavoprotein beta subunit|nr:electron transfer flavoprotein subunit beta/FixA family protein [Bacteroidales bacterium]MCI2122377.1 electron transfer flavoprotein subunit beta/FixA family protein [Bacteroidales bacterium]MCI2144814.1 electron transfer flavoprotein subunit beta/FixA family protein [Bacteroidales bacterium]
MNIVVCIKQVPDTNEIKINPVTHTLMREGVPAIMNPDDKGGLELALRLKEANGGRITVISMGPMQAELVLREALAMGADRAILLTDRAFAGADTLATSNALAGALRCLEWDVIIAGRQAIDGDTAQVPPEIAEHLGIPQVTYVTGASFDDGIWKVRRETEDCYEDLEVEGKCLLSVLSSAFKPRYMNVSGIVEAYDREIEIWNAGKIDVDPQKLGLNGSPTKVKEAFAKSLKSAGKCYEVGPEEGVELIVKALAEKHII